MEGAKLQTIEMGALDALNKTLNRLTIIESGSRWSEIYIDGFTGSEQLTALTYVKFNYNLANTITHQSFVGLRNILTLDLSECQIVTIGSGAFDPISDSIKELNLNKNKIVTLPEGLFYPMLPNAETVIRLDGNKWDCVCDLMPFKICLMENSNFVGTFTCDSPTGRKGSDVITTAFCENYEPPLTTTVSTTPTTPTTTTLTTTTTTSTTTEPSIPEQEEFDQMCYDGETESSKTVSIKMPKVKLTINEINEHGDVMVEVDKIDENSVLIWFSWYDRETVYSASDDEITCLTGVTNSITIRNLKEDTPYTFCLMESNEKTVSPLDCVSYTKLQDRGHPWIFSGSKGLIIGMVVLACFVSGCIGVAAGFFALNQILKKRYRNQNPNMNSCINDVLKEAFQSNSMM